MANISAIKTMIGEHDVKFVDIRFTGTNGQWHRLTYDVSQVTEAFLKEGVVIDGSSIRGWREVHDSDMCLIPDASHAILDPFAAQPTLILFGNIVDPRTKTSYLLDPRSIAQKAEKFLLDSKVADTAYFGPEPEFFVFDDVQFTAEADQSLFMVRSEEMSRASFSGGANANMPNLGHRPGTKGGYFTTSPLDSGGDMRGEMLEALKLMGVEVEKHHHEVAAAQHEIGFKFNSLVRTADHLQIMKYAVKNVAHTYGKTATFMPKPIEGENGSGMHVHQSLWREGKPLFSGNIYAGLSETALFYLGGILKHAPALTAFTNPTTNSYKRLVPGFEAPTLLGYSFANRTVACRVPMFHTAAQSRVEMRFPDPIANPYLAMAAMLMAGIDGIQNKIHPGEAMDGDRFEAAEDFPTMPESLEEALFALEEDHEFLLEGDVFTVEMLESYIDLKYEEVMRLNRAPHPLEYVMYYGG